MERVQNTVFISYRRTDVYTALAVYENLKNDGYDVFFDYRSISSGDFEQIIISNIRARAHFLIILTSTALDRCNEPGDWLRREIEIAIDEKRNIVPLFFKGFSFSNPSVADKLTGKMQSLRRYNGLNVHEDYFDEAIQRLQTQYLSIPLDTVLHPVSNDVQKVVTAEKVAADQALQEITDVKKLVNQPPDTKPAPLDVKLITEAAPSPTQSPKADKGRKKLLSPVVMGAIGVLVMLVIWGGLSFVKNQSDPTPEATVISQPTMTLTPNPSPTSVPPTATVPSITPTVEPKVVTGKDGMTLIEIPAGEFKMGSIIGQLDERPIHTVMLDAFFIDQTEVTNAMYRPCVEAGKCKPPRANTSITQNASNQSAYYGNPQFDNYPVIYVDWNMAHTYCTWVERRLPTEAEWEKAASWDETQGIQRLYPWGSKIDCSFANFYHNKSLCVGDTVSAGSYPTGASFYGVLDMAGNVWEWVQDRYDPQYYEQSARSNPTGPSSGDFRVIRGGSFLIAGSEGLRSAARGKLPPDNISHNVGFRCAIDAP